MKSQFQSAEAKQMYIPVWFIIFIVTLFSEKIRDFYGKLFFAWIAIVWSPLFLGFVIATDAFGWEKDGKLTRNGNILAIGGGMLIYPAIAFSFVETSNQLICVTFVVCWYVTGLYYILFKRGIAKMVKNWVKRKYLDQ